MKAPKPPPVPSVQDTISQQTQSNVDTLQATQAAQSVNQTNPYGSLQYSITGTDPNGNPIWTANSQMSPEQQAILNNLQQSQTGLGGIGGNLVNDVTGLYSQAPDFSENAGTQTRINMDRQLGYLQPFFTQQTEQLDNQLRNQGLNPGTEAYDRAMRTMRDNQAQSVGSFLNQTQNQAFQQAQAQYNQPMDTLGKIFGLTQPVNLSDSFVDTPKPTMNATDVGGITNQNYQSQLEAYKAKLAQHNAMMSGIFGLGTAGLMGGFSPMMGMMGPLMGMFGNQGSSMSVGS